jgi:hypothetical protein
MVTVPSQDVWGTPPVTVVVPWEADVVVVVAVLVPPEVPGDVVAVVDGAAAEPVACEEVSAAGGEPPVVSTGLPTLAGIAADFASTTPFTRRLGIFSPVPVRSNVMVATGPLPVNEEVLITAIRTAPGNFVLAAIIAPEIRLP